MADESMVDDEEVRFCRHRPAGRLRCRPNERTWWCFPSRTLELDVVNEDGIYVPRTDASLSHRAGISSRSRDLGLVDERVSRNH